MRRHLFGSVRLSRGEPVVMHDVERAWRRGYWLLRARYVAVGFVAGTLCHTALMRWVMR